MKVYKVGEHADDYEQEQIIKGFAPLLLPDLNMNVLDIGCGYQRFRDVFIGEAANYIGIDKNPQLHPSPDLLWDVRVNRIPFSDEYFDLVFTCTVLMHIAPE